MGYRFYGLTRDGSAVIIYSENPNQPAKRISLGVSLSEKENKCAEENNKKE